MEDFLKKIKLILWLFVFFGIGTGYLDYYRMTQGEQPIFCKITYAERSRKETYRGIFYVASRTVKQNINERLELSSNIRYKFLNQTLKINLPAPKDKHDFVLLVTPAIQCPSPSKLYYEYEDKKVYLDCVIDVRVKEAKAKQSTLLNQDLEKNPERIEDILKNLSYTGTAEDGVTEKYITEDDTFSNKKLIIYRCHGKVNDIYITQNDKMEEDYCTKKEDTLKEEEPVKEGEESKEENEKGQEQ